MTTDPILAAFVNRPDDPADDPVNVTDALFAIAQAIDALAAVVAHLVPDEARR